MAAGDLSRRLRLNGLQSIRAGMQALMHDIRALLAMALRQPPPRPDCNFGSAQPPFLRARGGEVMRMTIISYQGRGGAGLSG
jgi:hypothetical protein